MIELGIERVELIELGIESIIIMAQPPNTNIDAVDENGDDENIDTDNMFISASNDVVEPAENTTTNINKNDVCNFRCIFIALIMYTWVCVYTNYSYY